VHHTPDGVLRRLLDEPSAVALRDREHARDCPRCSALLAQVRADADAVAAATAVPAEVDVDLAWSRFTAAAPAAAAPVPRRRRRLPDLLRRPATAALAAAVVLTGAGTAAANGWLPVFATEQVAPVAVTTADLVALPDVGAYGTLEVVEQPSVREVADAAAAAEETGLDVPEVADLPRGVSGEPFVQVASRAVATFTFSAARAAQSVDDLPPLPAGLDGSTVRLEAGPGVAQTWTSDAGAPALVVARAVAPSASSTGVPFEVLRDYLLSLPGLPPAVAAQLRTFTADGATLPLPVPADEVRTSSAEVGGRDATVLQTRDRALAAVVWVEEGTVTAVAGSLDVDEVLAVARGLR